MSYKHSNPRWWRDFDEEGRAWSEAETERKFGRLLYKDERTEVRERATFVGDGTRTVSI